MTVCEHSAHTHCRPVDYDDFPESIGYVKGGEVIVGNFGGDCVVQRVTMGSSVRAWGVGECR